MKRIGRLLTFGCASMVGLALLPSGASAQLDHLICYKVIDKAQITAAFDLFTELQPEFTAKRCRIVKVDDFCVPSTKLNVEPALADQRPDIAGPPLYVDYIGYLVKCETQGAPTSKIVVDQFGGHRHRRHKVHKVYVPAKKGPPPCGTINGKLCGGVCPDPADQCRIDSAGDCRCAPAPNDTCGGKPDKQGFCGGPCPDPGEQCQVVATAAGDKICSCEPPPPPICGINTATGTCGGECPNKADKCIYTTANQCTCVPATTPCGLTPGPGGPVCGGDCPIAGDVCALDPNDQCRCGPPEPTPCQRNPFTGACGGECPTGQECLLDVNNECSCGGHPCGSTATGQCGGECPDPAAQTCKVDASGACNCDPPSCGVTGANTCGGACPATRECRPFTAGTAFRCACQ